MAKYARHLNPKNTPQSEAIPGKDMMENNAGGFVFQADDFTRLDRFLCLGCEGNTYYCTERKMTLDNAACVSRCLESDPVRTVRRIVEISVAGRAPKNDPAIFALAIAAANPKSSSLVKTALPSVCRTGTMMFQFVDAVNSLRGWGRGLRSAVANWYTSKTPDDLAYQIVKYQSREKWTHKDVLRLCHAEAGNNALIRWTIGAGYDSRSVKGKTTTAGEQALDRYDMRPSRLYSGVGGNEVVLPAVVVGFEMAKKATTAKEVVRLVRDYNLPREAVPTQFLTDGGVWEALLEKMPMTAMIRNLATMTRVGLIAPLSNGSKAVMERLGNVESLKKARAHPLALLVALKTYAQGHGERGGNSWTPVPTINAALDAAFYVAFGAIEPTNKRWLLALDVSGSMDSGQIAGMTGITPRIGSAAMALVTAAVEKQHHFVAFTADGWYSNRTGRGQWAAQGYPSGVKDVDINPKMRLDDVINKVRALPMGGTDCALPMLYATEKKIPVDVFVTFTDNETYAGTCHPSVALNEYRQKMGIDAKMIVVGMTATGFTIADPADNGSLDVCGFDTAVPQLMSDFVKG